MSGRAWVSVVCALVAALAFAAFGCASPTGDDVGSASAAQTGAHSARTTVDGLTLVDLFVDDATTSSPVVVVLHGYGGKPEDLFAAWSAFPGTVRFVLPQGPIEAGDGYSWFDYDESGGDAAFGRAVAAAGDRIMRAITKHVGTRPVLVAGISQGGFVAYGIASRHPTQAKHVFPIAASSPGPLLPRNGAHTSPILAFHGRSDDVVSIQYAREAVAAFRAEGNEATLREYANVGHAPSERMIGDVHAEMARRLGAR